MRRFRLRLLMAVLVAVALAWGASPELRAATKAAAKATAKAAAKATAKATAAAQGGGTAQKATNPGQTIKQKKQLAVDRQNAAKKAAAAGFSAPAVGTAAMLPPDSAPFYYTVANWANSPWPVLVPGAAVPVGNPLIARGQATDTASNVFVALPTGLTAGTLVSFQTFNQPGSAGNTFHAYVLRPTGVANEYTVLFDSGLLTVPALPVGSTGQVETFTVSTPVTVQATDRIAWYGQGIPWDLGSGTDQLCYPADTVPAQGTTITVGGAAFPLFPQSRTYSFGAQVSDPAQTAIVGGIQKFVDTLPGLCDPAGGTLAPSCPTDPAVKAIPIGVPQDWCAQPEAIAQAAASGKACVAADYYEIGSGAGAREDALATCPDAAARVRAAFAHEWNCRNGRPGLSAVERGRRPEWHCDAHRHQRRDRRRTTSAPLIVASKDKPVRIKFVNLLPTGDGGDLFLPVDTTFMGAGQGPLSTPGEADPQNRRAASIRSRPTASPRIARRCTCTAASRRGSATARRTSGSRRPARPPATPRASACGTCPTWARCDAPARGCHDVLLHEPAECAPALLPRPRLGHHPPQRVRGRGRGIPDYRRGGTGADCRSARQRGLRHPARHPGPDVRSRHGAVGGDRSDVGPGPVGRQGKPVAAARLHADPEPRQLTGPAGSAAGSTARGSGRRSRSRQVGHDPERRTPYTTRRRPVRRRSAVRPR